MEMTRKTLQQLCKQHSLYRTPHLNDKLYANFQGFSAIENLEEYSALKALFLEGNSLTDLDGLPHLPELKCLFVQQNRISKMEGLERLPVLNTLNISNNELLHLSSLDKCSLETLVCAHNKLSTCESVEHISAITTLQTLDLQNNNLEDPAVLDIFISLPHLKCLYLKGNPVVSKIPHYRKTLVASLPELTYLDDRPVFPKERELVQAWAAGGLEGERTARDSIRDRERQKDRRNFEFMQAIRSEAFRQKRESLGLPPGDTNPALDKLDDEEWAFQEDPPELVEARKKLEQHLADSSDSPEDGTINCSTDENDGLHYQRSVHDKQKELGPVASGTAGLEHHQLNPSITEAAAQLEKARLSESAELTMSCTRL